MRKGRCSGLIFFCSLEFLIFDRAFFSFDRVHFVPGVCSSRVKRAQVFAFFKICAFFIGLKENEIEGNFNFFCAVSYRQYLMLYSDFKKCYKTT